MLSKVGVATVLTLLLRNGGKRREGATVAVAQLLQQVSDSQATIASLSLQVQELLQELRAGRVSSTTPATKQCAQVKTSPKEGVVKTQVQKLNGTVAASSNLAPSAGLKPQIKRAASKVQSGQPAVGATVNANVKLDPSHGICAANGWSVAKKKGKVEKNSPVELKHDVLTPLWSVPQRAARS